MRPFGAAMALASLAATNHHSVGLEAAFVPDGTDESGASTDTWQILLAPTMVFDGRCALSAPWHWHPSFFFIAFAVGFSFTYPHACAHLVDCFASRLILLLVPALALFRSAWEA